MRSVIRSLLIFSWICKIAVWLYSFAAIIKYLGWLAILLLFLFPAVIPISLIGLFFKEQWASAAYILAGLFFSHLARIFALWLEGLYSKKQQRMRADYIDVESMTL